MSIKKLPPTIFRGGRACFLGLFRLFLSLGGVYERQRAEYHGGEHHNHTDNPVECEVGYNRTCEGTGAKSDKKQVEREFRQVVALALNRAEPYIHTEYGYDTAKPQDKTYRAADSADVEDLELLEHKTYRYKRNYGKLDKRQNEGSALRATELSEKVDDKISHQRHGEENIDNFLSYIEGRKHYNSERQSQNCENYVKDIILIYSVHHKPP